MYSSLSFRTKQALPVILDTEAASSNAAIALARA